MMQWIKLLILSDLPKLPLLVCQYLCRQIEATIVKRESWMGLWNLKLSRFFRSVRIKLSFFFLMYHKQYLDLFFWRFRHLHGQGIWSCKDWTDDGSGLLGCFCCLVAWNDSLEQIFACQMEEMHPIIPSIRWSVVDYLFQRVHSNQTCPVIPVSGSSFMELSLLPEELPERVAWCEFHHFFVLHSLLHPSLLHYGTLLAHAGCVLLFHVLLYVLEHWVECWWNLSKCFVALNTGTRYDSSHQTADDYTLMLEGVPPEVTSERRLHRYLEKELNMEGRIYGVCSLSILASTFVGCKQPYVSKSKTLGSSKVLIWNASAFPWRIWGWYLLWHVFFTHIQSGYHFFGFRCFHPALDIWGIMYDLVHLDEETNEKLEEMLEHIIELDDIKNGWASQAATK